MYRVIKTFWCCMLLAISLHVYEVSGTVFDPSSQPSGLPTSDPSSSPSSLPSSEPTSLPSGLPSSRPSIEPTGTPSSVPINDPTSEPSHGFPTSQPTTEDSVRTFNCGKCERTYFDSHEDPVCQFYSKNILLKCPVNGSTCVYSTYSFALESLSNIEVSGGCGLAIKAYWKITLAKDSSITASYMNFSSANQMLVSGTLTTSGQGPTGGPGSGEGTGRGGSYGGSGGYPGCTPGSHYANYVDQIGSLDVKLDSPPAYNHHSDSVNPSYPTMGSGGGQGVDAAAGGQVVSGGRGGGSITLRATRLQLFDGRLYCDGEASDVAHYGSGSGGSISIVTSKLEASIQKPVLLSVRGGDGDAVNGIAGGGGGRVSIHASNATGIFDYTILRLSGGSVAVTGPTADCLNAAGGTVYVSSTSSSVSTNPVMHNMLTISNVNSQGHSWAVTVLDEPSIVNKLTTLVIFENASVAVDSIAMCYSNEVAASACDTSLSVCESTLLPRDTLNGAPPTASNVMSLSSNIIDLTSHAAIRTPTMLTLDAVNIVQDASSVINFGCWLEAAGQFTTSFLGTTTQVMTPTECSAAQSSVPHTLPPGFYTTSKKIATIGQVISQVVAAKGLEVNVFGPYVGVPSSFNLSSCFSNVSALNMTCAAVYIGNVPSTKFEWREFSTNQVLFVANVSITVHADVHIEASLIEMCSVEIEISHNATFDARGRGCRANEGVGLGAAPRDGVTMAGGGGAGFGGRGGAGSSSNPGGVTYGLRRETFSVGSGGGAAEEAGGEEVLSSGGGFVLLAALTAINHYGVIKAGGRVGVGNAGGGSGGMVYLYTEYLHGNGSISVTGGNGGLAGGGGGGGGHIEIDAGGLSAKYDYKGSIYARGGQVIESEETAPYPYPGQAGYITWPSCPPGYGNDYSNYAICYACAVGYYSEGGDGECVACTNKPSGSDYITSRETSSDCDYECHTGRQGSECYTSFAYFVNYVGGLDMFAMYIGAALFALLAPLLVMRVKKASDKKKKEFSQRKKKHGTLLYPSSDNSSMSNFFSRFPMPHKDNEYNTMADDSSNNNLPTALLMPHESTDDTGLHYHHMSTAVEFGGENKASFQVLRLGKRLGDKDLRYHVGRIYLEGVNSPFDWLGGSWTLSETPPAHLQGLFVDGAGAGAGAAAEGVMDESGSARDVKWTRYSHFVQRVNKEMAWDMGGWEVIYYYWLLIFIPPRAERFLLQRRLVRATKFIDVVSEKEWRFFASHSTSLRVGISPDFTVATLDFVHFDTKNLPRSLRSIGQPRLPICLRFCGLGTYFSPWYIDTNDVLMQSVAQTNEVCIFIDKAWINFIIELNLHLRKLRRYSLTGDLMVFIQKLLEEKLVGSLGGIITQFCCYLKPPESEKSLVAGSAAVSGSSGGDGHSPERGRDNDRDSADYYPSDPPLSTPPSMFTKGTAATSNTTTSSSSSSHKKTNTPVDHATFEDDIRKTDMLSEFASMRNTLTTPNNSSRHLNTHHHHHHHHQDSDTWKDGTTDTLEDGLPPGPDIVHLVDEDDIGEMKRPVGFGETCRLITRGEVFPGLMFFHESTSVGEVVADDDDDDATVNLSLLTPGKNMALSGATNGVSSGAGASASASTGGVKADGGAENISKFGEAGGGRDVYGSKMDELDKFYKILASADEKNTQPAADNFPVYRSTSDSLYHGELDKPAAIVRLRGNTTDSSEMSSQVSVDYATDERAAANMEFRKILPPSPLSASDMAACHSSAAIRNSVQVWSWSCRHSKPMLLTRQVFSNCTSVSSLKVVYPTTIEIVGEALSHLFRCEMVLRQKEYTLWEHVVKFTAMMNRMVCHGSNKSPRSKLFHHLITALFVLFIFIDIGCTCYLSLTYWCVWGNRTQCDNHTGLIVMHSVWPGALIMAPIMGLRVLILNSTGTVARQYMCWSRLACINCLIMVLIYFKWQENADTILHIPMLVAYSCSRLFQNYYFDVLIAFTENKRSSRGWNGLYTSVTNFENHEFS